MRALLLATMAERDTALSERDQVVAERDAAAAERDAALAQNDRLRHLLLKLRRMQFGTRSERLPEARLQLGLEDLEAAIAKGDAGPRSATRPGGMRALPSAGPAAARSRRTCRGSRSSCSPRTPPARAAAAR